MHQRPHRHSPVGPRRRRSLTLVAIDIGNSTVAMGLFAPVSRPDLVAVKRLSSSSMTAKACRSAIQELLRRLKGKDMTGVTQHFDTIIASVVPHLTPTAGECIVQMTGCPPLVLDAKLSSGLAIAVARPSELGADRIAGASAAWHRVSRPVAVVDFGTATTITVVGPQGSLRGGSILPGLGLMGEALLSGTAQLPLIPLKRPKAALGTTTRMSISSGIINGTAGAVERLVRNIEKELGFDVQLIVTGGYGALMSRVMTMPHVHVPTLTFEGLRVVYMLNTRAIREDEQS